VAIDSYPRSASVSYSYCIANLLVLLHPVVAPGCTVLFVLVVVDFLTNVNCMFSPHSYNFFLFQRIIVITYTEPVGYWSIAVQCLRSPYAKFQRSSAEGPFSNWGLNRGGVGKIGDFQPISRRISETVRDRSKVTIDD